MTEDNSDIFEIFNMSRDEQSAISEFTGNCVMFVKYCQQEFNLDAIDAHFVAGVSIQHFCQLIEANPDLKQTVQRSADFLKHLREESSKKTSKNPPDEAG